MTGLMDTVPKKAEEVFHNVEASKHLSVELAKRKGLEKLKYVLRKAFLNLKGRNWQWFYNAFTWTLAFAYFKYMRSIATSVLDLKWDNLIILDACRYDTFCRVFGEKVPYIISKGSDTPEWLIETFKGKQLDDIVYVTANPFPSMLVKDCFHEVIPAWRDIWNEHYDTVLPFELYELALKARKKYPDKRLIVHFIQPHAPFLDLPRVPKPFHLAHEGKLSTAKLWKLYENNLRRVLPVAVALALKLNGETIITSDHGEVLKKVFFPPFWLISHPTGIHIKELVKVPLLRVKGAKNER